MEVYDKLPVSGTTPEHIRLPQSNRLIAPFMFRASPNLKQDFVPKCLGERSGSTICGTNKAEQAWGVMFL